MKTLIKISFLLSFSFLVLNSNAQISAGLVAGTNLSRLDDFSINKEMLRPGIYGGIYGDYKFNNWLSAGLEIAWSEKSISYCNRETYSSIGRIQSQLQLMYPQIPDVADIITNLIGMTGMTFNDSVYESNRGLVTFRAIEAPILAKFHYKNFVFEVGPYVSYLIGAKTENTFLQDCPLFKAIPPSNLDSIPLVPMFINMLFPALNNPRTETSVSTSKFANLDYGVVAGIKYKPNDFLSFGIRYTHGLVEKLSPNLPSSRTHSVFQFSVSYNLFGKLKQKPMM